MGTKYIGRKRMISQSSKKFQIKENAIMILPDYHIHTLFSPDSQMDPEATVRAAIAKGVTHLCFTEHMDLGHHMEMYY